MEKPLPAWALRQATSEDYRLAKEAHERGRVQITLPDRQTLRAWAKARQWPTPWFGFNDNTFIRHMFATPESFALALSESGLTLQLPRQEYTIPAEKLRDLDEMYEATEDRGVLGRRATRWGPLVEELRDIRRAVEAGVVVEVENAKKLRSFNEFYTWAHGRYHALEDGYDSWIGDDNS
jgi:hypothetical protein